MGRNFFDNPLLLLVLVLLIVLIFGAKRLPDITRNVGRSMRIFKSEVKDMRRDSDEPHSPSRPVEGRVVDEQGHQEDDERQREARRSGTEHPHDA